MSKTVTLRLDESVYDTFVEAARAENRSLASLIQTAAMERVRESQFVDDLELAEVMANEKLIQRIKKGSKDARGLSGRFVE